MHELAICQSLMDRVESIALERDAQNVTSIVVAMGPLSGVEAQLLKNAYSVASAGTIAEDAELIIEYLPVRVQCTQCDAESEVLANKLICKECGDWRTSLISGDELMLMSVELEKKSDVAPDLALDSETKSSSAAVH